MDQLQEPFKDSECKSLQIIFSDKCPNSTSSDLEYLDSSTRCIPVCSTINRTVNGTVTNKDQSLLELNGSFTLNNPSEILKNQTISAMQYEDGRVVNEKTLIRSNDYSQHNIGMNPSNDNNNQNFIKNIFDNNNNISNYNNNNIPYANRNANYCNINTNFNNNSNSNNPNNCLNNNYLNNNYLNNNNNGNFTYNPNNNNMNNNSNNEAATGTANRSSAPASYPFVYQEPLYNNQMPSYTFDNLSTISNAENNFLSNLTNVFLETSLNEEEAQSIDYQRSNENENDNCEPTMKRLKRNESGEYESSESGFYSKKQSPSSSDNWEKNPSSSLSQMPAKRSRGRPKGTKNKKILPSEPAPNQAKQLLIHGKLIQECLQQLNLLQKEHQQQTMKQQQQLMQEVVFLRNLLYNRTSLAPQQEVIPPNSLVNFFEEYRPAPNMGIGSSLSNGPYVIQSEPVVINSVQNNMISQTNPNSYSVQLKESTARQNNLENLNQNKTNANDNNSSQLTAFLGDVVAPEKELEVNNKDANIIDQYSYGGNQMNANHNIVTCNSLETPDFNLNTMFVPANNLFQPTVVSPVVESLNTSPYEQDFSDSETIKNLFQGDSLVVVDVINNTLNTDNASTEVVSSSIDPINEKPIYRDMPIIDDVLEFEIEKCNAINENDELGFDLDQLVEYSNAYLTANKTNNDPIASDDNKNNTDKLNDTPLETVSEKTDVDYAIENTPIVTIKPEISLTPCDNENLHECNLSNVDSDEETGDNLLLEDRNLLLEDRNLLLEDSNLVQDCKQQSENERDEINENTVGINRHLNVNEVLTQKDSNSHDLSAVEILNESEKIDVSFANNPKENQILDKLDPIDCLQAEVKNNQVLNDAGEVDLDTTTKTEAIVVSTLITGNDAVGDIASSKFNDVSDSLDANDIEDIVDPALSIIMSPDLCEDKKEEELNKVITTSMDEECDDECDDIVKQIENIENFSSATQSEPSRLTESNLLKHSYSSFKKSYDFEVETVLDYEFEDDEEDNDLTGSNLEASKRPSNDNAEKQTVSKITSKNVISLKQIQGSKSQKDPPSAFLSNSAKCLKAVTHDNIRTKCSEEKSSPTYKIPKMQSSIMPASSCVKEPSVKLRLDSQHSNGIRASGSSSNLPFSNACGVKPILNRKFGQRIHYNNINTESSTTPTSNGNSDRFDKRVRTLPVGTSSNLKVGALFGLPCFKFLINDCTGKNCKYSHKILEPCVIKNRLKDLNHADLANIFQFTCVRRPIFKLYCKEFIELFIQRKEFDLLTDMITYCANYPEFCQIIWNIYSMMVRCGETKYNAANIIYNILKRNGLSTYENRVVYVIVDILYDADWTKFTPHFEAIAQIGNFVFKSKTLNDMAAYCKVYTNNMEANRILLKCIAKNACDMVTVNSTVVKEFLAIIQSSKY